MKKIKISASYNSSTHSYEYTVTDKKTKKVIIKSYYKPKSRTNKTTGDIAKEIYENLKDTVLQNYIF